MKILVDADGTYFKTQFIDVYMFNETAYDAQKQFVANIEDLIAPPVDLPSAI